MGCLLSNFDFTARRDSSAGIGSSTDIKAGMCNADPITAEGQRTQMIQMLSIPLIPIVILVIQAMASMINSVGDSNTMNDISGIVDERNSIKLLILAVQHERKQTMNLYQHAMDEEHDQELDETFIVANNNTIKVAENIENWEGIFKTILDDRHFESQNSFIIAIKTNQQNVTNQSITESEAFAFYNYLNERMIYTITSYIRNIKRNSVWMKMLSWTFLIRSSENFWISVIIGGSYFEFGQLDRTVHTRYIGNSAKSVNNRKNSERLSDLVKREFARLSTSEAELLAELSDLQGRVRYNRPIDSTDLPDHMTTDHWNNQSGRYVEHVHAIMNTLDADIDDTVDDAKNAATSELAVSCVLLVVILLCAPLVMYFIYKMTKSIQSYAVGLSHKTRELRREKKKSDTLLYQMMPKSVALQLKLSKRVTAETFNAVTIFFSDIVGFTAISARSAPMQVVEFLNNLYYFFDTTIEKYDTYKVETIGDAYMVASGLPQRNGKRHVAEIASLSLELRNELEMFKIPHLPAEQLKLRIGIHTGPVVAGVVGSKMPRYCLFGETVNIASLMESNGLAHEIQLSHQCNKALMGIGGFTTELRGVIDIAGFGDFETHFLRSKLGSNVRGPSLMSSNASTGSDMISINAPRSTRSSSKDNAMKSSNGQ